MSKINQAIREIHTIDQIARKDQWVNSIHPLVKLFLTVLYIALCCSFNKYDIIGLVAMAIYPIILFNLAELSFRECLWRLRVVLPLVLMVGIANPFVDKTPVVLGSLTIRAGLISMVTLMMKGTFAVFASYLLIATTTIEKICYAFRCVHLPNILVTQFLLTYRYITLLLAEVHRITDAYSLRAPNQKGVHFKVWGSLTGQLLLRSIDRANDVYESMCLRGYNGEFHYVKNQIKFHGKDLVHLVIWTGMFILCRTTPILLVIGNFFGGFFA